VLAIGLIASVAVSVGPARADAIARSRARLTSPIAEFFITDDGTPSPRLAWCVRRRREWARIIGGMIRVMAV
jgi:hypothetical protein